MPFRTKLDYSDNRQIKQRERTNTILSGGTVFGLPYSGLSNGVDLSSSGGTEEFTSVVSTFSGNASTTIFTWYDGRMSAAESSISAITSTNSGVTQETGVVWVVDSTGTTADGYDYNAFYTGVSFDFQVSAIVSGAGPTYVGTVTHDNISFYSANSLDYTGRTIWVDNPEITRTKRLIVTDNPVPGHVLTCLNSEGEYTAQPISGITSGVTFWEEDGTGLTALKDEKGLHTINGVSDYSIIAGGYGGNIDTSPYAALLGGSGNTINDSSDRSVILGGINNTITSGHTDSAILGGTGNTIHFGLAGDGEVIIGSTNSSITGGTNTGIYSSNNVSISGNEYTTIIASYNSSIIDETSNAISNVMMATDNTTMSADTIYGLSRSIAIGGSSNRILGAAGGSLVGAVNSILKGGNYMGIFGGRGTVMNSNGSYLYGTGIGYISGGTSNSTLGGINNTITETNYSAIIAGNTNSVSTNADLSVIIGGGSSLIDDSTSALIAGGVNHNILATSDNSVIIGGSSNLIDVNSELSAILGGTSNTINTSSDRSTIIGGSDNLINGADRSTIIGGQNITATTDNTVYMNNLYVTDGRADIVNSQNNQTLLRIANHDLGAEARSTVLLEANRSGTNVQAFVMYAADAFTGTTTFNDNGTGYLVDSLNISSGGGTNSQRAHINIGSRRASDAEIRFFAGNDDFDNTTLRFLITTTGTTVKDDLILETVGAGPGTTDLGIDANGVVVDQASDINLKENIETLENALDQVLNLRGVTYNWKDRYRGGDAKRVGFIAQEVSAVSPLLAYTGSTGYMGVHYKDVTALLVEAVKELASSGSPIFNRTELILETQTIASEDNNIELNFNGTHDSAINGGITVIKGIDENTNSEFMTNSDGDWTTNNHILPNGLVIPEFTPTSTNDLTGKLGEITRDDNYIYIKTNAGWKRTGLETF